MLLELRLFSLLDSLLDASQRLGCSLVGLGSVAQPGVDLVSVVWFHRSTCVKLHDAGQDRDWCTRAAHDGLIGLHDCNC